MKRSTSNQEVKKLNRNRVFRYVNSREETSMPEISAALSISGPTVLKIVNELKEEKLLREVGEFESTGGRKAKAIAAVRDVKYAIGLDITKNHVGIVYTDLSGKALKHERVRKPFKYSQTYLHEVAAIVRRFVEESRIPKKRILGMGISVPAIIDVQRDYITNSHALGIYDVPCEELTACMPYPCELLNDANAAAITESNRSRTCSNLVYLFLSNTVGGAIIFGNENGIVRAAQEKDRSLCIKAITGEAASLAIWSSIRKASAATAARLDAWMHIAPRLGWQIRRMGIWRDFSERWKQETRILRRYGMNI